MDKYTREMRRKLGYEDDGSEENSSKNTVTLIERIDAFFDSVGAYLYMIFIVVAALIIIALVVWGVSALPISAAILIGALVIASSIRK